MLTLIVLFVLAGWATLHPGGQGKQARRRYVIGATITIVLFLMIVASISFWFLGIVIVIVAVDAFHTFAKKKL
jgi:hypothetical protein